MFNRWRDEIASGAEIARAWSDQLTALIARMLVIVGVVGFSAGLVVGGFLVWLTK